MSLAIERKSKFDINESLETLESLIMSIQDETVVKKVKVLIAYKKNEVYSMKKLALQFNISKASITDLKAAYRLKGLNGIYNSPINKNTRAQIKEEHKEKILSFVNDNGKFNSVRDLHAWIKLNLNVDVSYNYMLKYAKKNLT